MVCAVAGALAAVSMSPMACSTVIVGKDASATGDILIGHNEDNGGRIFNPQYYVPPTKHKAGTMNTYEPTAAKIPQVRETLGFYWSQTLDPNGASFSDGFVNDAGVVIVSNACTGIYVENQKIKDGGVGYGIRRIMAERAHSAREAVDITIDLLGKYGYFSEGRTYTIADHKEAWQLAIHDPGYCSTSADPYQAQDFGKNILILNLPKGLHAISTLAHSEYDNESEILLDRGVTGKIQRLEHKGEYNLYYIDVKLPDER